MTHPNVPPTEDAAKRAAFIADLHAFADFLSYNSWAPLPYPQMQADLEAPDVWNGGLAGLKRLRRIADGLCAEPDERLDDRTSVTHRFGAIEYRAITWHKDGRPVEVDEREAELARLRARIAELESPADPSGLAYTRADTDADDPTPVSPARVPLHTGSVVADGVLVTDSPACTCAADPLDCVVHGPSARASLAASRALRTGGE